MIELQSQSSPDLDRQYSVCANFIMVDLLVDACRTPQAPGAMLWFEAKAGRYRYRAEWRTSNTRDLPATSAHREFFCAAVYGIGCIMSATGGPTINRAVPDTSSRIVLIVSGAAHWTARTLRQSRDTSSDSHSNLPRLPVELRKQARLSYPKSIAATSRMIAALRINAMRTRSLIIYTSLFQAHCPSSRPCLATQNVQCT
jgi:hypothetical protein